MISGEPERRARRQPEVDVEGTPELVLRDEDREAVADALADLLLQDLDQHQDDRKDVAP